MKKTSKLDKIRADAQALLDETTLRSGASASRLHRFLNFWALVWQSFTRNRCPVRASALAYTTLLAFIPLLAVVMSITSTFLKREGEERIDHFIVRFVASLTPPATLSTNEAGAAPAATGAETNRPPPNPLGTASKAAGGGASGLVLASGAETRSPALPAFAQAEDAVRARRQVARQIHEFIQNTRSGALGLTGSVLLIFAAISMLSRIEDTFNDIWGVARGRSWFMRVVLYWGVLSLAPLLVVAALGLATGPHLEGTKQLLVMMPFVGDFLFRFLPIVVLCLTFALFYMLMPNTKVHWRAALAGGLVSGVLFHLNNLASVLYVSRVVSNSRIYGSLALVPVFMIGLYFGWLIVLFGAQVAYAFQNRAIYLEEKQIENVNQRGREFIALRLMTFIGRRFGRGEMPPTIGELAEGLAVPTRLAQQILQTLAGARLVVETAGADVAYLPARPLASITCYDVLLALRASQGQELATRDEPMRTEVYGEFQRIMEAERQTAASVTLLALANRVQDQALGHEPRAELGQGSEQASK